MAYSYVQYDADGIEDTFTVTFGYIKKADVDVQVDGTPVSFTWPTTSTVKCDAVPGNGTKVLIIRTTNRATREVDFTNASVLDEETLDKSALQLFYVTQEAFDDMANALQYDPADGTYDADSKKIKNLAAATNDNDAVRLIQISSYLTAALAAQTAAELAQTNAETAETNAETAETNAETAETNAETAESHASEWADNNQDVEITFDPGKYSAKHWAAEAEDTVTGKADRATGHVTNDVAKLDADGDPVDAGFLASAVAQKDVAQEYTKQQNFNETALSDGATINWDTESNQVARVTIAGDRTMAAPTNLVQGATYILTVIQDGTGNRTLTWNAVFKWEGGTAPDLASSANERTVLTFLSDGTNLYGGVFWKEN